MSGRALEQLKVPELREELRKRGLDHKGLKKDLLERLEVAIRDGATPLSHTILADQPQDGAMAIQNQSGLIPWSQDQENCNEDPVVDDDIASMEPLNEGENTEVEPEGAPGKSSSSRLCKVSAEQDFDSSAPNFATQSKSTAEATELQLGNDIQAENVAVLENTEGAPGKSSSPRLYNVSAEQDFRSSAPISATQSKSPAETTEFQLGNDIQDENGAVLENTFDGSKSHVSQGNAEVSEVLCTTLPSDEAKEKSSAIDLNATLNGEIKEETVCDMIDEPVPDGTSGSHPHCTQFQESSCTSGDAPETKETKVFNGDKEERAEKHVMNLKEEEMESVIMARESTTSADSQPHANSQHKRKDGEGESKHQEPAKRQRRWNSGNNITVEEAMPLSACSVKDIKSPKSGDKEATVCLTPKIVATSRPPAPSSKAELSTNGPRERSRVVPPSLRSPTTSLKIDRFLRPFTLKAVKELLSETGELIDFWMDLIKTHCYVTFSSVSEAVAMRDKLHDLQWPPSFGHNLCVDFVDPEEVKMRCDGRFENLNVPLAPQLGMTAHQILSPRFMMRERALPPPPPLLPLPLPLPPPPPPMKEVELAAVLTLDDLFTKTKAKPHIYYLPLSDSEAAKKLAMKRNDLLSQEPLTRA